MRNTLIHLQNPFHISMIKSMTIYDLLIGILCIKSRVTLRKLHPGFQTAILVDNSIVSFIGVDFN